MLGFDVSSGIPRLLKVGQLAYRTIIGWSGWVFFLIMGITFEIFASVVLKMWVINARIRGRISLINLRGMLSSSRPRSIFIKLKSSVEKIEL
jgi:hypothetical protein